MLICILTKNVITSCSVTMMLFLHLEVKPLMTLTTVLYLSCALISGRSEERFSRNAETDLVCRLLLEKKKKKKKSMLHSYTHTRDTCLRTGVPLPTKSLSHDRLVFHSITI